MSDERVAEPYGWTVNSYEDYCAIEERVEVINGEVYAMGAPTANHQRVAIKIGAQLDEQLSGKTCEAFIAPMDVKLPAKRVSWQGEELDFTLVQPDVFIVCDESKVGNDFITGAPDFVVEVLSPSTRSKDFLLKFNKYAESGVKEYWLIDIEARELTIIVFTGGGTSKQEVVDARGKVFLRTLEGLFVDFDEAFERVK
jgi:Uma2 family endonuclease